MHQTRDFPDGFPIKVVFPFSSSSLLIFHLSKSEQLLTTGLSRVTGGGHRHLGGRREVVVVVLERDDPAGKDRKLMIFKGELTR